MSLEALSKLGKELADASDVVERIEEHLLEAKKVVSDLADRLIPEVMENEGVERFTTAEGVTFKIDRSVHAHISKDRHEQAMKWLDDNGHGHLMRRNVIIDFDREQEVTARELAAKLAAEYPDVKQVRKVHPSTLRMWAREQLEAGADVPQDLFGIHVRRVAKIG